MDDEDRRGGEVEGGGEHSNRASMGGGGAVPDGSPVNTILRQNIRICTKVATLRRWQRWTRSS